jgi:outer membrane protein
MNPRLPPLLRRRYVAFASAVAFGAFGFPSHGESDPEVREAPEAPEGMLRVEFPLVPPTTTETAPLPAKSVPKDSPLPAGPLSLPELVELGLKYNPVTRLRWAQAKAAAAARGEARAPYFPYLELGVEVSTVYNQKTMPLLFQATNIGPSLNLTWLLIDFGARQANVNGADQALLAANHNFDQGVQDVVLSVVTAYYLLAGNISGLRAAETTFGEASTSLASAESRLRDEVGTVTDVYLARAQQAQSELEVVAYRGKVAQMYGVLSTAMGLPANTHVDVVLPNRQPQLSTTGMDVDQLIQNGLNQRPDLEATRAQANQAHFGVDRAESDLWPTINVGAGVAWMDPSFGKSGGHSFTHNALNYDAGLIVSWPLFEGFALRDAVRRSRAVSEGARARVRLSEETVTLQIWSSYQALITADQSVQAAQRLLASADLSYQATLQAYRAGVTTIVELMESLSLLASARYETINARTDWYVALAQLARDTGQISSSGRFGVLEAPHVTE